MFFFIGFPILSYSMQPHATNIGYTKPYAKQNQPSLLSSYIQIIIPYCSNTLPISRAISLSKLGNTVNNNSIFNTKCVEFSTKWYGLLFSQPCLCLQPPLKSSPKICYPTSANFHLLIPSLLVHEFIRTIPTNTPFL